MVGGLEQSGLLARRGFFACPLCNMGALKCGSEVVDQKTSRCGVGEGGWACLEEEFWLQKGLWVERSKMCQVFCWDLFTDHESLSGDPCFDDSIGQVHSDINDCILCYLGT